MAVKKEVVRIAKLEFNAGQAKPGPELAGLGIVMPNFTKAFNDATKDRGSEPVPVQITVYKDKSFDFKLYTAPAAYKLKEAAKIKSGSANAKTKKVATITKKQLEDIATYKLVDLNTNDVNAAMRTIAGTAKNMGILIEGWDDVQKELAAAKQAEKDARDAARKELALEEAAKEAIETKGKAIEVEVIKQKEDESEGDK